MNNTWTTRIDKQIRCKCGKEWGINKFRSQSYCKRCKTTVIARGEKNDKQML